MPEATPQPYLSIVIPAYNEAGRIHSTLEQWRSYLEAKDFPSEVIVADDGSTDDTPAQVTAFSQRWPLARLISLPHGGKGSAVRAGMLAARGEYRFMADADLSMPVAELDKFLPPRLSDYDIALGSREAPGARRLNEPRLRHLMGRGFNLWVCLLAVPGIKDTQCGFKCFRGPVAQALFPHLRLQGFGFDVEALFLAQRLGLRLVEVPIEWHYRSGSKVRPWRHTFTMAKEVLAVRYHQLRGRYAGLLKGRP